MKINLLNKLIKINNDLLVFTSFNGKYADSPKAISNEIHKQDPTKEIVWLLKNPNDLELPSYCKKIKIGTPEANKYRTSAKAIVDNVYCGHEYYTDGNSLVSKIKFKLGTFLKYKKGQKYYTTWHGSVIKRIGSDSVRNKSFNFSCPNTTMFLDNQFTVNVMKRITKGTIDIKLLGEPRNDILFNKTIDKNKIKEKLKLPMNKKTIIYAPTFRSNDDESKNIENSGVKQMNDLDIDTILKSLSKKFGGDWVFIVRFHYHVEKAIDWDKLRKKYGSKIINGNQSEDIMDYLVCCDALMTDISSCIYDFSLTNKPAFSYFPDFDHYANDERGLYFKKEELPWKVTTTPNDLYDSISNFDQKKYEKKLNHFYDKLGFTPKEPCAEKIAKYILEDLKK